VKISPAWLIAGIVLLFLLARTTARANQAGGTGIFGLTGGGGSSGAQPNPGGSDGGHGGVGPGGGSS